MVVVVSCVTEGCSGVLIVVGACPEGAGSPYFLKLAEKYPTPESVLKNGLLDDSFGIHKLVKTARHLGHFRIFYVTSLDEAVIEKVYCNGFRDITQGLAEAYQIVGENARVAILEDAGYSVPLVKSADQ